MIDIGFVQICEHALRRDTDTGLHHQPCEMILVEQIKLQYTAARSVLRLRHIVQECGPSAGQRETHEVMRTRILGRMQTHQHVGLVLYVFGRETFDGGEFKLPFLRGGIAALRHAGKGDHAKDQKDDMSQLGHEGATITLMAL